MMSYDSILPRENRGDREKQNEKLIQRKSEIETLLKKNKRLQHKKDKEWMTYALRFLADNV